MLEVVILLSNKVCGPKKKKDFNILVFNMITGKNENILTKEISCESKSKFDGRKCNSNQKWNNRKCQHECIIFGILLNGVAKVENIF